MRHFLRLLVLGIVLGFARNGQGAESQIRVVVLHSGQTDAMVRLDAELRALGYRAVPVLHPKQSLWADQVRTILRANQAAVVINATSLSLRVDVWILSPKGRGQQLTVDTVEAAGGKDAAAATILKTVETLRAGLIPLEQPVSPRQVPAFRAGASETYSSDASDRNEQDAPHSYPRGSIARTGGGVPFSAPAGRLTLAAGPSLTYGFADFPAEWQIVLSGRIIFGRHLGLTLSGYAPTAAMVLETSYGTAQLRNGSLLLGLQTALRPYEKQWVPWIEIGVGPHFTRMKGRGIDPYPDGDDRLVTFEILFRLGMRLRLSQRVALETALHVGDYLPQPTIRIGETVAEFSRPVFGGIIQLSLELF